MAPYFSKVHKELLHALYLYVADKKKVSWHSHSSTVLHTINRSSLSKEFYHWGCEGRSLFQHLAGNNPGIHTQTNSTTRGYSPLQDTIDLCSYLLISAPSVRSAARGTSTYIYSHHPTLELTHIPTLPPFCLIHSSTADSASLFLHTAEKTALEPQQRWDSRKKLKGLLGETTLHKLASF